MKKEYNLKSMKIKRRGPLPKGTKVQKTLSLDLDVLNWFIQQSEQRGIPYQTLINATLKCAMNTGNDSIVNLLALPSQDLGDDHIRQIVREEMHKKASGF